MIYNDTIIIQYVFQGGQLSIFLSDALNLMTNPNIQRQNEIHQSYKSEVVSILRSHGIHVADMEDSFGYKKAGNHFLVSRECGSVKTVRLITDKQIGRTGNFFIEIEHHRYSDESKTGPFRVEKGWFLDDSVDVLFVYDVLNHILYGLSMPALQYGVDISKGSFKPNRIDKNCMTSFKLVSLKQCRNMGAFLFKWSNPTARSVG